jgi:hypothetical protein
VGGGTGPADGTRATTCTPAPIQMQMMLQSTDDLPLNFGFSGKVCFFLFCLYTMLVLFFCSVIFPHLCSILIKTSVHCFRGIVPNLMNYMK